MTMGDKDKAKNKNSEADKEEKSGENRNHANGEEYLPSKASSQHRWYQNPPVEWVQKAKP